MTNRKNPDLCQKCGAIVLENSCQRCPELTAIAVTMAPSTIYTSADILTTLQRIVQIGASIDTAREVVNSAMRMNVNCVGLADEIVAGWHRKQRGQSELPGLRKIHGSRGKR